MTTLSERPAVQARRLSGTVRAYVALTKPRIIELLLVTTVPAMMLAERGIPSPWLVFATLFSYFALARRKWQQGEGND